MAIVARPCLRGLALYIMWRSIFKRRQFIKIRKSIFHIIIKGILSNRHVSHDHKIIRTILGLQNILSNLEIHICFVYLKVRQALLILSDMASIAILVSYRMTNLACHFYQVSIVHRGRFFQNSVLVAVLTFLMCIGQITTCRMILCGMHLFCKVAFVAVHVQLRIMNVGRVTFIFAHIFMLNPATMASRTVCFHVRALFEKMPIHKSALNRIRTADVALSATRMATRTMITEGFIYFIHCRLVRGIHSRVQNLPIRRQSNMKTFGCCRCDLLVTTTTGTIRFFKGGVSYNSFMSRVPIRVGSIAPMA